MDGKERNVPTRSVVAIAKHMTVVRYVARNATSSVTNIVRWRPQRIDTRNMTSPSAMPITTMHKAHAAPMRCLQLKSMDCVCELWKRRAGVRRHKQLRGGGYQWLHD
jgi:hypothetical protein